jgi:hypothetical protein
MINKIKNGREGGFIKLIILIVVVLLLMRYFNLTITGVLAYFHLTWTDITGFLTQAWNWFVNLFNSVK